VEIVYPCPLGRPSTGVEYFVEFPQVARGLGARFGKGNVEKATASLEYKVVLTSVAIEFREDSVL
jgi:hypothetical protein